MHVYHVQVLKLLKQIQLEERGEVGPPPIALPVAEDFDDEGGEAEEDEDEDEHEDEDSNKGAETEHAVLLVESYKGI